MPQRMITAMVGMIYITVAAILAVSLVSAARGGNPQQPLTFATLGMLLIVLIALMAFSSRNKERYARTDIRFYRQTAEAMGSRVKQILESKGQEYRSLDENRRIEVHGELIVRICAHANNAEVLIEKTGPSSKELSDTIKCSLEEATA